MHPPMSLVTPLRTPLALVTPLGGTQEGRSIPVNTVMRLVWGSIPRGMRPMDRSIGMLRASSTSVRYVCVHVCQRTQWLDMWRLSSLVCEGIRWCVSTFDFCIGKHPRRCMMQVPLHLWYNLLCPLSAHHVRFADENHKHHEENI